MSSGPVAGQERSGGSPSTLELGFPDDLEALAAAQAEMRRFLEVEGVRPSAVYAADLALEELVGNTIRHGLGESGAHVIRVLVSLAPDRIELTLEDDAPPFDPTAQPEPERPSSLEETRIGGLGISMIRRAVAAMRYRREDGRNHLELEIPRERS
jgi:anti-sigma regulatory factor (Ser/Thr protein kinase)